MVVGKLVQQSRLVGFHSQLNYYGERGRAPCPHIASVWAKRVIPNDSRVQSMLTSCTHVAR